MTTGIIYLAKNTISLKCYVGKTTRTLEQRKKEHLRNTIKEDYKFGRALQKYPKDSWEWTVLAEVSLEELEDYEIFFIRDLDTYKNGYNTLTGEDWKGRGNPRHNSTIYDLWHPEHGRINETITELYKRSDSFTHIQELFRGTRQHIAGFVLYKNKDTYNDLFRIYDFYHPNHGVVSCTSAELFENYKQYFNSKETNVYKLTGSEKCKTYCGWCLAKNKDNYENLTNRSDLITLTHLQHGTLTLRRSEFRKRYSLHNGTITCLKNGKIKNSKGWTFVNNEN